MPCCEDGQDRCCRLARIAPRVTFRDDAAEAATLVEIVAQDRPGLLHDLADAITHAECNIEVVMIDTEAHKALDVFYITHRGRKLDDRTQDALKSGLLTVCAR